jgi:hypothetical protein
MYVSNRRDTVKLIYLVGSMVVGQMVKNLCAIRCMDDQLIRLLKGMKSFSPHESL